MSVAGNIATIEERIQKACHTSGRKRDEVTLMGITKFVPIDRVEEAWHAGIRCFGESRVNEATEKLESFRDRFPAELHMVGSLQRNKAKPACLFFDCIQSVDRDELIAELVKYAGLRAEPLAVLLELHTGEETKSGYKDLDSLFRAAEQVLGSAGLKLRGLMTMAPFTTEVDLIRGSFRQLVKAQRELERRFPPRENWECLSMGMSNDFEIAVEEGSTMLRVGSSIFGK